MRIATTLDVTLSNDISSTPKSIRFSEFLSDIDITSLTESVTRDESWAAGTYAINMSSISAGKFIYFKTDIAAKLTINGVDVNVLANKPSLIWCSFSSISLTFTATTKATLVIAG